MDAFLTTRQWAVLWALLDSPNQKSAAKRAGVSVRTVKRYLLDDMFRKTLNDFASSIAYQQIMFRLHDFNNNHKVLRELRDSEEVPPSIRLQVIQYLEHSLATNVNSSLIETRLSNLEELANEL